MKLNIEASVTVITPTIGKPELLKAIDSVMNQTYKNLKHLVVIDGADYGTKAYTVTNPQYRDEHPNLDWAMLPYNTGGGGFYGHRIYAGFPHLINTEYICFLDEDNWFEPDHVKTLVSTIESQRLDWAYSLRNIYTPDEKFVAKDDCESLGKWPIYWSINTETPQYLVDTSSYCFRTDFLKNVSHLWHSGWGGDRRFYQILTQNMKHTNYDTSGKYTLNYRLDDAVEKKYGDINFFANGNELTEKHYGGYPWRKI